jgi:hypothetical protein
MRESLLPPALEQCEWSDGIVEQPAVRGAGNIIAGTGIVTAAAHAAIIVIGPNFHFHNRGGRRWPVEVGDSEPIAEAPRDGDVGGGRNMETGMERD